MAMWNVGFYEPFNKETGTEGGFVWTFSAPSKPIPDKATIIQKAIENEIGKEWIEFLDYSSLNEIDQYND